MIIFVNRISISRVRDTENGKSATVCFYFNDVFDKHYAPDLGIIIVTYKEKGRFDSFFDLG